MHVYRIEIAHIEADATSRAVLDNQFPGVWCAHSAFRLFSWSIADLNPQAKTIISNGKQT